MEKNTGFQTAALAAGKQKSKNINISQVLVVQPPRREAQDIKKLISAAKSADRGKRSILFDIYDNIIADPVIGESIRKRIRHVTNGGLVFQRGNKTVNQMADLIQNPAFRRMLEQILLTRFYGKTIVELVFNDGFKINKIPRRNLDTEQKKILKQLGSDEGFPYEDDDFLLNVGEDDDLGLLFEVAPFAIFKRNGGADYADFCELWGIPILSALYDPEDENGREEMEETMQKRGAGGSIVASKNSQINSIESSANGAIHDKFLDWLDNQILIGLVGQMMTTKDGSSLSQSKTHAEVEDDINEDDQVYILEVLNTELLPRLEKRGYPIKGGWFSYPKKDNLSLKEKLEIAEKVDDRTEHGVDENYWYETFGIPKGNKATKTDTEEQQKEQPDDKEKAKDPPPEKEKQPKKVKAKDLSMFEKLKDFFDRAPL